MRTNKQFYLKEGMRLLWKHKSFIPVALYAWNTLKNSEFQKVNTVGSQTHELSNPFDNIKALVIKFGRYAALKEYLKNAPKLTFDIDAGPVVKGLSPSGTAFALGAATYFEDWCLRKKIAQHSIFGRPYS